MERPWLTTATASACSWRTPLWCLPSSVKCGVSPCFSSSSHPPVVPLLCRVIFVLLAWLMTCSFWAPIIRWVKYSNPLGSSVRWWACVGQSSCVAARSIFHLSWALPQRRMKFVFVVSFLSCDSGCGMQPHDCTILFWSVVIFFISVFPWPQRTSSVSTVVHLFLLDASSLDSSMFSWAHARRKYQSRCSFSLAWVYIYLII